MSNEDQPALFGYDQEELAELRAYLDMDLGEQLDRFEQLRAERVALLSALDTAGWSRIGNHDQYGPITIHDLMAHMAKHDAVHLAQVARLVDMLGRGTVAAQSSQRQPDGVSAEELERETDAAIGELYEHKRARSGLTPE
jgi:DinB superfamily